MICTARRTNGKPCGATAIKGGRVCRTHGGAAPQVREAARERLLSLVDPALGVLARAVRKRQAKSWEPSPTELRAVSEILTRAGIGEDSNAPIGLDDGRVTWEEFVRIYRRKSDGSHGNDPA